MGGHFYEYDAAIAAAAFQKGISTLVYAHKSCDPGLLMLGGEIHPWFSTEWSASGWRGKALARALLHKLPVSLRTQLTKLGRQLRDIRKRRRKKPTWSENANLSAVATSFAKEALASLQHAACNGEDIIFVPTIRTSELYALWKAIQISPTSLPQIHVVLRRDAAEMDFPEAGAPGVSVLFRELAAARDGKAFRFYCDTQQLCDDYAKLSSGLLDFLLLPIPFPNAVPETDSLEKWSAGSRIKLAYLGGARVEKGFHLIPPAANSLQKIIPGKLLWRLQAPASGAFEEREITVARRHLSTVLDGSIDLVERNLTSEEFQSLLLSADIILLPYLPEFYRARSSGVLVQVLAAGKPVIVPSGTWLSNQTNGKGAIEFTGPADFADAVLKAVQQLPQLTGEAQNRAPIHRAFHNADALLRILEDDA